MVIHTGYCKTATTSFQDNFYALHPEIDFWGKQYSDRNIENLINQLKFQDDVSFDVLKIKNIVSRLERNTPKNKIAVISDESLSNCSNTGIVLKRIREVFEDVKILITIREQFSLLSSMYSNQRYIFKNVPEGCEFPVSINQWLSYNFSQPNMGFIGTLRYDLYIKFAQNLFGIDNVKVLLFEDFIHNKDIFICNLCEFIGIDDVELVKELLNMEKKNSARNYRRRKLEAHRLKHPKVWKIFRQFNFIRKLGQIYSRSGQKGNFEVPLEWRSKLEVIFKESNKKLAAMDDLDIKNYNYV